MYFFLSFFFFFSPFIFFFTQAATGVRIDLIITKTITIFLFGDEVVFYTRFRMFVSFLLSRLMCEYQSHLNYISCPTHNICFYRVTKRGIFKRHIHTAARGITCFILFCYKRCYLDLQRLFCASGLSKHLGLQVFNKKTKTHKKSKKKPTTNKQTINKNRFR